MSHNRRKRRERRQRLRRENRFDAGHATVTAPIPVAPPPVTESGSRHAPAIESRGLAAAPASGPARLALSRALLTAGLILFADLAEYLLTLILDAPALEYAWKLLARHWRETDYGLPFLARYFGFAALLGAVLNVLLVVRLRRTAARLGPVLAGLAIFAFFIRGAVYASLRVQLNLELVGYLLENGALLFEAEGADLASRRVPWALVAYLAGFAGLLVWIARKHFPAFLSETRWPEPARPAPGLAVAGLFVTLAGAFFLSGASLAGTLAPADRPGGEQVRAAAGDLPPPDAVEEPGLFPFRNAFRERYGFRLKPGTNVVVLFLESARAPFVPLEGTRYFRPGDRRVVAVDDFFVPVPHSSNSHYSLFTGLYSARKASDNFDRVQPDRTLPGVLAAAGYANYYLYGGEAKFDREDRLIAKLGLRLREKKDFESQRDGAGKRRYTRFWWGVDDRALVDETKAILQRESGPLFLSIVFTNSHHRYFNPRPDLYRRHDNTTDVGRHRNAIEYALDLSDEVVDAFRARGRDSDTLFILLADHGESFGEHGFIIHDFSLYDAEIRVPFAMRHPRFERLFDRPRFPAGSILDVFPTVADALGLPFAGAVHGRTLFDPDYRLRLIVRPWGGDDSVGLIDGSRKWIYARNRRELERFGLRDEDGKVLPMDAHARALVDRLASHEFVY